MGVAQVCRFSTGHLWITSAGYMPDVYYCRMPVHGVHVAFRLLQQYIVICREVVGWRTRTSGTVVPPIRSSSP